LTKAEGKSFGALSAIVDRATTKGLTPEEAVFLKEGLAALAEKHPKGDRQHGLTTIANTLDIAPKPAVAVTTPSGTAPAAKTTAVALPGGKGQEARVPEPGMKPGAQKPTGPAPATAATAPATTSKPAVASMTPVAAVQPTHTEPKPTVAPTTAAPAKPSPSQVTHVDAKPQVVAPKAPVVAAPKAPQPALAAAKPPAAPAAKPQTCTPNMQNGKMMGMICH
jgi:hypothetical protein